MVGEETVVEMEQAMEGKSEARAATACFNIKLVSCCTFVHKNMGKGKRKKGGGGGV